MYIRQWKVNDRFVSLICPGCQVCKSLLEIWLDMYGMDNMEIFIEGRIGDFLSR